MLKIFKGLLSFSKMKTLYINYLLAILVQYCFAGTTFVAKDATLYDANGKEFIIRGNKCLNS